MRMNNPPHPGRVLREYLGTRSVTDTAKHLGVTRVALSRILNGSAGISADMALKLADALSTIQGPPSAPCLRRTADDNRKEQLRL
jgi:addiction module HigA family antidote